MRTRLVVAAALSAAVGLTSVALAQGLGKPKTVSTVVNVSEFAGGDWIGQDSGFTLQGETVTITGAGKTSCGGGPDNCVFTPDGILLDNNTGPYTADGSFLAPGLPIMSLIARVGTSGPWTFIGAGPTTLSGTGDIYFAVNDNYFPDNAGGFTATISITCYPGKGLGDSNHTHCGPPGQNK